VRKFLLGYNRGAQRYNQRRVPNLVDLEKNRLFWNCLEGKRRGGKRAHKVCLTSLLGWLCVWTGSLNSNP